MLTATVSSAGRILLPKAARKHLGVRPGDTIGFSWRENGVIIVRKLDELDVTILNLTSASFADWDDPEAERAFARL